MHVEDVDAMARKAVAAGGTASKTTASRMRMGIKTWTDTSGN
jgi:hypothetical protein